MRIAIFFAMEDEFLPFRNLAKQRATDLRIVTEPPFDRRLGLHFQHHGHDVYAAVTGTGRRNAYNMAWNPVFSDRDCFFTAGVAGGLTPALAVGQLVVGAHVWRWMDDAFELMWSDPDAPTVGEALVGDIITSPRVVGNRLDKVALLARWKSEGRDSAAVVVDMETAGIAWAAQCRNTSFFAIRAVSDTADEDLPLDFNLYLADDGSFDRGRIAREAVLRPTLIRPLSRLGRNTKLACLRLAVAVWDWLDQVPVQAPLRR